MHGHKDAASSPIRPITPPKSVSISLSQHIGKPAEPTVAVGDTVLRGQVIGRVENALGCPVHASVSGKVTAIENAVAANGQAFGRIVIENDFQNTPDPFIADLDKPLKELTAEDVVELVKQAGISGMGGAGFPTYAKISSALGKVDRLIVNCVECEPYITANHRLLLENTEEFLGGVKILLKTFGLRTATIAIEDNKLDAADAIADAAGDSGVVDICVLQTKYPQGDERQIIRVITGKEMPAGSLPSDVGCVVFNAETVRAVFNAVAHRLPLIERVVTVSGGCIKEPANLLVPIGTPYQDLLDFCGGPVCEIGEVINGGPMMGAAHWDLSMPVTKTTSALLFFPKKKKTVTEPACIRCGRCVEVCPMHLMPNYLASFAKADDMESAERFGVKTCMECGTCAYVCPAKIQLVQYFRMAKAKLRKK